MSKKTLANIGIIGFGNMGSVIAYRLSANYEVIVFDKDKTKLKNIKGLKIAGKITELLADSNTIILAVKPQDAGNLLKEIGGLVKGKLIISIAAGLNSKVIEKNLKSSRVVRVMPNIAALIGESVTSIAKGETANDDDLEFVKELFYRLGAIKVIDEDMINAATVIAGSGPGFIFYFLENYKTDPFNIPELTKHDLMKRLERAAAAVGFSHEDAVFLAANVTNCSINLTKVTKISCAELKKQVTSKGGTTEAGLNVLIRGGSWEEAAVAALKRAQELSG